MTQDIDDDASGLKKLQEEAWKFLKGYLAANSIPWTSLSDGPGSKSQVTISRYFGRTNTARKFQGVSAWIAAINPIFTQVQRLAGEKGASPSWHNVFGPNVPEYWALDSTALARPRLHTAKLPIAAMPLIEELRKLYESERRRDNVWKTSELLVRLCSVLELAAKWDDLPNYLDRLATLNARTGDFHFEADARLRQAQALFQLERFEEAADAIRKGMLAIEGNKNRTPPYRTQLRLLNYRAAILMKLGEYAEALEVLANQCLPLAVSSCSDSAVASVQNRLGIVYLAMEQIPEAEKRLTIALRSRLEFGMLTEAARTVGDLGRASITAGNHIRALLLLELSLDLHRANNDEVDMPKAALACGLVYMKLHGRAVPILINGTPAIIGNRELSPLIRRLDQMLTRPISIELRIPLAALDKAKEHLVVARYLSGDDPQVFEDSRAALERIDRLRNE